MELPLQHPGFDRLNRYADGELGDRERARVARHLARCDRCRTTVDRIRALGEAARSMPTPELPDDILETVLERRQAGERVILPLTGPGRARRRATGSRVAAVVGFLAVAATLVFMTPEARAGRSELTFAPAQPAQGATLDVTYEGTGIFEGEERLVLRARYRTIDRNWILDAATLRRHAGGLYHGTVDLPDSVVYAAFVVEDQTGRILDSNHERYWEVLTYGEDGRPTFDALYARMQDLFPRDWEAGLETARTLTRLYPDEPRSWSALASREREILDETTFRAQHSHELTRLEGIYRDANADAAALAGLAQYARTLNETEKAMYWARCARQAPGPIPVDLQVFLTTLIAAPDQQLQQLDELWQRQGPHEGRARRGFGVSLEKGSPDQVRLWYERIQNALPDPDPRNALELLKRSASREYGIRETRALLREWTTEPIRYRNLRHTVPAATRERMRVVAETRVDLAEALIEAGRSDEAVATLEAAVPHLWSTDYLERAGEALLAHGRTEAAATAFVRILADPSLSPEQRRKTRLRLETLDGNRDQAVADARSALENDLFQDVINRYVDLDAIPLGTEDGGVTTLADEVGDDVSVVVSWSRLCLPALEEVPKINTLAADLRRHGIPMVVVTPERHNVRLLRTLAEADAGFQVYSDLRGRWAAEFINRSTPRFYVLDGRGRIRFEEEEPELVGKQAVLLQARTTVLARAMQAG